MSSSDSDDDCYGNIAQKLQSIKNTYDKDKVLSTTVNVLNDISNSEAESSKTVSKNVESTSEIAVEDFNVTVSSVDNDEFSLDAIIANNSKTRSKRGRGGKRKTSADSSESSERPTRSSKRKTKNSNNQRTSPVPETNPVVSTEEENLTETAEPTSRGRGRSSRGSSSRGRRSRGGRGRRGRHEDRLDLFSIFQMHNIPTPSNSTTNSNSYPIYSIGNTDEYPDQCDNQQLFAKKPLDNDIEVIDNDDPLEDDNEELSVKVYWQNSEVFKFTIRKYQKLTPIFNYFTQKEGVSNDKLLLTYNDKILKIDDTPDTINYSIAKFIDGGVVNQNVTELTKKNGETVNTGLKIKFQCQNMKKPFETKLRLDDKFGLAMTKCAEHLETPIDRLKFYFDGDLISSKTTPKDLELEGDECIDVKICS